MDLLREFVGGPKNRYKDEKFNLDLTYITPRLIAMAFPASGIEKLYRNSIDEVKNFLEEHHSNQYMILNLSGRQIDESKLSNVLNFQWQDHQAPPLHMLFSICDTVSDFLRGNNLNVVVVHCNHGKGRTGTIICCLLLYCNMFKDAEITMDFYAKKRFEVDEGYGVTQPCQIQYVKYFEKVIKNHDFKPNVIALTKVIFRGKTKYEMLYIKAKTFTGNQILSTKKSESHTIFKRQKNQKGEEQLTLTLMEQSYFCGDCKIYVKAPSALGAITAATYSFNTAFVEGNCHRVCASQLSPFSLQKSDSFGGNFEIQFQFKYNLEEQSEVLQMGGQKGNKIQWQFIEEKEKWKSINECLEKRKLLEQGARQSMLGYHHLENVKKSNDQQKKGLIYRSNQINLG